MPANDGVAFDIATLRAEPIREEGEYGGASTRHESDA